MDLYIYIDEAGQLHKNSSSNHFVVGLYMTTCCNKSNDFKKIKNENLKIKKMLEIPLKSEVKSIHLDNDSRQLYLNLLTKEKCYAMIIHKKYINKEINEEAIWINYIIGLIIKNNIKKIKSLINKKCDCQFNENSNIYIACDERNLISKRLKSLEDYLKTILIPYDLNNLNLKVCYKDSKVDFFIQYADFVSNSLLICYQKKYITKDQINIVKNNIKYSNYPSGQIPRNEK